MSRNYEEATPGKIAVGSAGMGTVSPELVQQRAEELAQADGRTEVNDLDLVQARQELLPEGEYVPPAPEAVAPELENLTEWDTPPDASGGPVSTMEPMDEANIAEQLVAEGLAEADHDQRVSAADANPPTEE